MYHLYVSRNTQATFEAQFMKSLTKTEAVLKNTFAYNAYEKACILDEAFCKNS